MFQNLLLIWLVVLHSNSGRFLHNDEILPLLDCRHCLLIFDLLIATSLHPTHHLFGALELRGQWTIIFDKILISTPLVYRYLHLLEGRID
jgi:hypothetical protein